MCLSNNEGENRDDIFFSKLKAQINYTIAKKKYDIKFDNFHQVGQKDSLYSRSFWGLPSSLIFSDFGRENMQ
jgi:hypothetical protein